uniref:Uncharacterized protein n=1 Tax=Kalanchoe fedtschenkoi TaxID=63787 RepID=A0A7N0U8E6_KALFE
MRVLKSTSSSTTAAVAIPESAAPGGGGTAVGPRSEWRSPMPYVFGGVAAMMGLIAFGLLILACSYWNLNGSGSDEDEGVKGAKKTGSKQVCGEQFVVILAGDDRPTCLATPAAAARGCACSSGSDEKGGGGKAAAMADRAAASAGENKQQGEEEARQRHHHELHLQASSS